MSQFTAPLQVTPLDDGQTWIILTDDFKYDVDFEGSGDVVKVPQWMATDFASVPRPIWWFAAPWGKHGHAAVIHDAGYYLQDRSRRSYDRIFLQAMEVLGVRKLKRWAMYLAVRWFGFNAWNGNARRNREHPGWKIVDPQTIGLPPTAVPSKDLAYDRARAPSVSETRQVVKAAMN